MVFILSFFCVGCIYYTLIFGFVKRIRQKKSARPMRSGTCFCYLISNSWAFLFDVGLESIIVYGVMTAIIMFASYFNLKHFAFPDVEFGIIRSIRGYNLIALLLGVLSAGEMSLLLLGEMIPLLILYAAICAVSIAIVPILEKGVKKWTI